LNAVVEDHGVTHMAAICAICKSQFSKVMPYYGLEMDAIVSVHQLVSNAIVLEGSIQEEELDGSAEDEDGAGDSAATEVTVASED